VSFSSRYDPKIWLGCVRLTTKSPPPLSPQLLPSTQFSITAGPAYIPSGYLPTNILEYHYTKLSVGFNRTLLLPKMTKPLNDQPTLNNVYQIKKPICKVEDFGIFFLIVFKTHRCLSHTASFSCLRYFFASDYTHVYSANSVITTHFRAVILIHSPLPPPPPPPKKKGLRKIKFLPFSSCSFLALSIFKVQITKRLLQSKEKRPRVLCLTKLTVLVRKRTHEAPFVHLKSC